MSGTLRGRIVRVFATFAVVMAAVFGFTAAIFLYTAEDQFFNGLLAEEAELLVRGERDSGAWPRPRHPWMTVHTALGQVPADLREPLRVEPRRREFRGGEGRHYHVRVLRAKSDSTTPTVWLIAEVSDRLVIRPMRRELLLQWGAAVALLLAISLLLARAIARRIAQPLSALAASVRAVDPAGAIVPSPHIDGDHEVTLVAAALDDLRTRVADFVERERAFTRDASHELRTPLSVIRSSTEQALRDPALSPGTAQLLTRSHRAGDRLDRTVRTLLALAREAPNLSASATTVVLPLLEALIVEVSAALDAAGLSVRIDLPAAMTLPAPEAVVGIVLSNVLSNACAHGAAGVLAIRAADRSVEISNPVAATLAPPATALGQIGVRREHSPGYGLGLEMSARLCARAGLALAVSATDETFVVRIGPREAA